MKKCPYCAEEIQDEAIVCRYCRRDLTQNPVPATVSVQTPPKKKSYTLWIILALIGACVLIYLLLRGTGSGGGGGSGGVDVTDCASVTVTSCDLDSYGGYVHGTVKNICSGNTINAVKIIAEVYSSSGTLLATDEEYVENLAPGAQVTFKAIMDQSASAGKTCSANADSGN